MIDGCFDYDPQWWQWLGFAPNLAPDQVVIVPIYKNEAEFEAAGRLLKFDEISEGDGA